ncbi:DUF1778 domain-containing protein [Pseudomonas asiatica]|nr:DUF1778 domain-containing protein [Pseudomonas asiatica]MEB6588032.1 DUF1778 domain-containing protein [Pseudomonas asiatica]
MTRTVRLKLDLTDQQQKILRQAAKATGTSLESFVLNSACQVAEQTLFDSCVAAGQRPDGSLHRAAGSTAPQQPWADGALFALRALGPIAAQIESEALRWPHTWQ